MKSCYDSQVEREKCICNEGIHDGERIDCACKCHEGEKE